MARGAAAAIRAVVVLVLAAAPLSAGPDRGPLAVRTDVLVAGGSPAGVAAAVAAAQHGVSVVLVEPRPFLGTVWTAAMLNMFDLNRMPGWSGRPLTGGLFRDIHREVGDVVFDPSVMRRILLARVRAQPRITLMLETDIGPPLVEGRLVVGALVRRFGRDVAVTAAVTVDATDDGDVAAGARVPFTLGRQTSGIDRRMMAATLMLRLDGVAWPRVAAHARGWRGANPSGVHGRYAWGFRAEMRGYAPADPRLSAHDLNLGRLSDGTVWVNALHVHDVDGTDPGSRAEGYARALGEAPAFVAYLRAFVPGFANARLVEPAPELYIRETRHLRGSTR